MKSKNHTKMSVLCLDVTIYILTGTSSSVFLTMTKQTYKQILSPDVLLPSLATSLANAVSSALCFRVASQHQQVGDTLMGSPPWDVTNSQDTPAQHSLQ